LASHTSASAAAAAAAITACTALATMTMTQSGERFAVNSASVHIHTIPQLFHLRNHEDSTPPRRRDGMQCRSILCFGE